MRACFPLLSLADPRKAVLPGGAYFLWSALCLCLPFSEHRGRAAEASSPEDVVFAVAVDEASGGKLKISPPIPEGGKVPAGTVLTLAATPEPDFAIDSLYAAFTGHRKWTTYVEGMRSPWQVTVDRDMRVGASFIEAAELEGFTVTHDVVYAQPGVKPLKYDVFSPIGAENLPIIVIIHGGGWTANNEDVMRGLARELVRDGDYVVFSIDYRWRGNRDGDETPNTLVHLIEDVFGAIAHIREHAADFGADPDRIAVTGDSAGGHLSAAAATLAERIGDGGYENGAREFLPSYLPEGMTADRARVEIATAIRAAAPSYGVFGAEPMLKNMTSDKPENWWEGVAPIKNIPQARQRHIPHFLLRGIRDWIKHDHVQAYADALSAAGHRVEYVQPEGVRHAFLDWKPDPKVKETFRKHGVHGAVAMKAFFDSVFYLAD